MQNEPLSNRLLGSSTRQEAVLASVAARIGWRDMRTKTRAFLITGVAMAAHPATLKPIVISFSRRWTVSGGGPVAQTRRSAGSQGTDMDSIPGVCRTEDELAGPC
jgi:hypothetical protein